MLKQTLALVGLTLSLTSTLFRFLIFSLLATHVTASTIELFGGENGANLYSMDTTTGQASLIGDTSYLAGMDFSANGTLYGSNNKLYTVDTSTGDYSVVGDLPELIISLAFSPTGELYGLGNGSNTLWEIDPATGNANRGVFLSGGASVRAMDFAPDGTLLTIGLGYIYSIDTLTGVMSRGTRLSNLSVIPTFDSLDYGADGFLRGGNAAYYSSSDLYEIDPLSGAARTIGPSTTTPPAIGIGSLASVSSVPIPAAAWLFGSALIGLAGIKRKK